MLSIQERELFLSEIYEAKNAHGCLWHTYSTWRVQGKQVQVHRVAYILAYGSIPEGMVVRHLCESRYCVNPKHLRIGTQQENMWDYTVRRLFDFPPGALVGYEDVPEYVPPPFRTSKK